MIWIAKRVITSAITWLAAIGISILIIIISPGNPATLLLATFLQRGIPLEQARDMVKSYIGYSPEEPLWISWARYMQNIITGNLGISINYRLPVSNLIVNALSWSLFFVSYSLSIAIVAGVLLGLVMAYFRRNILFNRIVPGILTILNSVPNWILAAIFFVYIGARFKLLPYTGPYDPNIQPGFNLRFILSVLHHYTLPVLVMVLTSLPGWAFAMSSMATTVLRDDYVIAARARGIPRRRILWAYVARNSILPIYTNIVITFSWLLIGTVWIESQFLLPGIGSLLSVATGARDYPLIIGTYVIFITAIILGNLFTDLTYGLIDPRARVEE